MRKRIGIEKDLMGKKEVILIEEKKKGIDKEMRKSLYEIMERLRKEGKKIIM